MPIKRTKMAAHFIGRRGASLLFFGFLFGVLGWSYATAPDLNNRPQNLNVIQDMLPIHVWGYIWMGLALVCAIGAFVKLFDYVSFFLGSIVLTLWGVGQGITGLEGKGVHPWLGTCLYLAYAAMMLVISGWPEAAEVEDDE